MSDPQPDFFTDLQRELSDVWQSIGDGWHETAVALRNGLRNMRSGKVDYVVIPLEGPLPERDAPPRTFIERQLPLPPPPLSLQTLNHQLKLIADDDNVGGVLFVFRGLSAGLATIQNVRRSIARLKEAGKATAVYTPYLDTAHYYAACAADKIIIPPSAQFDVLGLRTEVTFFKDALDKLGIQAEAIQISPYKSGPDPFSKSEMTAEHREQLTWLLDDWFDMLTASIAESRGKTQEEVKQLINNAPHFAPATLDAGLVDHIAYEDQLAEVLSGQPAVESEQSAINDELSEVNGEQTSADETQPDSQAPDPRSQTVTLLNWDETEPLLREKRRKRTKKFIGVISLEGAIMMGSSRQSPIDLPIPIAGEGSAGEQTLVRLLRKAEAIDDMAALVFHVDTGGGSALASDLIGRQIERIVKKKPVVVYMGNAAASGGYYVSAFASHIMSQTGTLTGSIGVWMLRPSTRDLYEKLSVNRVSLKWGENADLYSDSAPLTAEQRQVLWDGITESYTQFKQIVSRGRDLPYDELDAICEGRVWLGRQAATHKLVDSHGDFVDAIRKAAELANLPLDNDHEIAVANFHAKSDKHTLPQPFEPNEAIKEMGRWLFGEQLRALSGQPLYMLPYHIRFW